MTIREDDIRFVEEHEEAFKPIIERKKKEFEMKERMEHGEVKTFGKLRLDCYPPDPREWDNLGTMVCSHKRYDLGDVKLPTDGYNSWEEAFAGYIYENEYDGEDLEDNPEYVDTEGYLTEKGVEKVWDWIEENVIWLPLMLYDHSGITMYVGTTGDRWDSGRVGYIYVTKKKARKELPTSGEWYEKYHKGETLEEMAKDSLKAEVEIYDEYLRGDVFCVTIYKQWSGLEEFNPEDAEEIDDVCGYFGEESEIQKEISGDYKVDEWLETDYSC